MNIELISSTSEETLISFGVFACAFFFALWKLYSNLRAQIQFYESQDVTGRLALQNDLTQMHDLIASLRREFEDVEKSIENDLVDLELGNMSLHPKLKNFEVKQSASSESIYNLLAKIEDALTAIYQTSTPGNSLDLSQPVKMLSNAIGDVNNTIGTVAMVTEQQNQMISKLQSDLTLIKRGHGLE
ncbi:MAG: hypothetical protein VXY42_02400 [Candidatus Thermoplasmatota archaeon]|nr:hypothetical protein [Candidatus Thermoplasmatota archaeon]